MTTLAPTFTLVPFHAPPVGSVMRHFLVGDAIKMVATALVLPAAWKLVK